MCLIVYPGGLVVDYYSCRSSLDEMYGRCLWCYRTWRFTRIHLFLTVCAFFAVPGNSGSSPSISHDAQVLVDRLRQSQALSDSDDWKRLGKIQLDAQEFAEAARIFRKGALENPENSALKHHLNVWQMFNGGSDIGNLGASGILPMSKPADSFDDIFLELPCPLGANELQTVKLWQMDPLKLVHASREPLLSREACSFIIEGAKETARTRGWTLDRHVQAPTCDIPAHDLPPLVQAWIRQAFDGVLYDLIAQAFFGQRCQTMASRLRVQDCFVVRYDGNSDTDGPGFDDLKPHQDESLISLTIALNDMDKDYQGGGLYIAPTQDLLNGPAGTVLMFAGGSIVHGGYPVTEGTRWILTAFLYLDENASGRDPGYTLKLIQR